MRTASERCPLADGKAAGRAQGAVKADVGPFQKPAQPDGFPENNAGTMAKPSTHLAQPTFDAADTSRIIEMAWEDRTPFEAIKVNYALRVPGVYRAHCPTQYKP